MKKVILFVLAFFMLTMVFTACTKDETVTSDAQESETQAASDAVVTDDQSAETAGESEVAAAGGKIGISVNALANVHNIEVFETTQEAAQEAGYEVATTNANGDATQQVADIENLIQQGCNVIIIQNAETDTLGNVVASAVEAGIYVISMESGWVDGMSSMFALNDFTIGSTMYAMLAAEMGYDGQCILINHNDHPAIRARRNVQEAVLREYTNIEAVVTVTSGYPGTEELAYNGVESALLAYPDVEAIWCTFDLEALGAARACEALGRDDIVIVGCDGELEVLRNIKAGGNIIATFIGDQDYACHEVIAVATRMINGENYERFYEIPVQLITIDNVDPYLEAAEAAAAQQ